MQKKIIELYVNAYSFWNRLKEEDGQDLVEYAAVISLVVLGITAGMTTLATSINGAMSAVGTKINSTIS